MEVVGDQPELWPTCEGNTDASDINIGSVHAKARVCIYACMCVCVSHVCIHVQVCVIAYIYQMVPLVPQFWVVGVKL